ncbi:facilitated trehalose transporter Tret1-like [Macrosteles quadrilineatus]|uniref:facilitated trehalose transporter Tret1-like n=1 Tax=Macrosteles quadrilineatus TaxID=74068 RepID=UPI0023E1DEC9|nr:facilitated trehalose transporter Tret1-like [Macrosteles quadrilineatus]
MSSKAIFRQYLAALLACISMMLCGASYGWTSPVLPRLLTNSSEIEMTPDQSSWVAAFVEVGNLFSPIPFGSLVDVWGRKPCILITGPLYIISWIIVLMTRSVYWLYVERIIQGIAIGIMCTAVPVYTGEIAQPSVRGSSSALNQGMLYAGIVYCYCLGPYMSYQAFAYANLAVAVVFVVTFVFMPESPYYLVMKNRDGEAAKSLMWLYGEDSVQGIQEELHAIKQSVEEDMRSTGTWWDLLKTPDTRRALLIVQVALIAKYMSGYLGIVSYATKTFTAKGDSVLNGDEWSILMGFILFLPMFVGAALVEKVGRRPLLMVSTVGCAICDLCAVVYYYLELETEVYVSQYSWIAFLCIASYCVLFSIGLGPLVCVLKAEFFPSNTRGKASAISNITETIACFICIKMYQVLADGFGMYCNFLMFATFCLLGSWLIYMYVPETTGMTFSEIQRQFHKVPIHDKHIEKIPVKKSIENGVV